MWKQRKTKEIASHYYQSVAFQVFCNRFFKPRHVIEFGTIFIVKWPRKYLKLTQQDHELRRKRIQDIYFSPFLSVYLSLFSFSFFLSILLFSLLRLWNCCTGFFFLPKRCSWEGFRHIKSGWLFTTWEDWNGIYFCLLYAWCVYGAEGAPGSQGERMKWQQLNEIQLKK